jgi:shikimate kinase
MDDAQVGCTTKDKVKEKIEGMSDEELNIYLALNTSLLESRLQGDDGKLIKKMTESINLILDEREAIVDILDKRNMDREGGPHDDLKPRATSSGTSAPPTSTTS